MATLGPVEFSADDGANWQNGEVYSAPVPPSSGPNGTAYFYVVAVGSKELQVIKSQFVRLRSNQT